jgi:hypothetical protein
MITTQTYVIITMILLGALWVALVFLLRPNCSLKGCKKGRSLTVNSRLKAPEDIIPIRNCSLFSALYVDWGDVPSFWSRSLYQPKNVSFLFRACWNVTTANCQPEEYDFRPPATFDTVVRIEDIAFTMYSYFLYSSALRLGVLVFTGTAHTEDWARNIAYSQVIPALQNMNVNTRVHLGFYSVYFTIQTEIRDLIKCYSKCMDTFVITGYSLGGGLAQLATLDLAHYKPLVYTFGSPRAFNTSGAKLVNYLVPHFWRIYNTEDIVADLPPPIAGPNPWIPDPILKGDVVYQHVGKAVSWTQNAGSILDNHSRAYEEFIFSLTQPKSLQVSV